MGKTSYTNGKKFEEMLCQYLAEKDYYVIYNEKGITGSQCCDIIAIKNNFAYMIEAKNLDNKSGRFPLSRIEANQHLAYKRARACGNDNFILAIYWEEHGIYFIDFGILQFFDKHIDLSKIDPTIPINKPNNHNMTVDNLYRVLSISQKQYNKYYEEFKKHYEDKD